MTSAGPLILSFDVGTTATKGILIDQQGRIVAGESVGYATHHASHGQVEQMPDDWWQAVCCICQGFWRAGHQPGMVRGIALTGQMQDVIVVDSQRRALGPALLYSDTRAIAESVVLRQTLLAGGVDEAALASIDGAAPLAKLVWLRDHQPERMAACHRVLFSAKDYVLARLTCQCATDATTAGTTGCYSLATGGWRLDWLAAAGLPGQWLPSLSPASRVAGVISLDGAGETGLPAGIPVHGGMGDAAAATLSAGLSVPGDSYMYLGTTAWAATLVQGAPADSRGLRHLPYVWGDSVIRAAPILNAGGAHQWIMALLGMRSAAPDGQAAFDYDRFEGLLQATAERSSGVIFLPYLNGERCPVDEPRAMGTFIHLGPTTVAGNLAWAVMEGICFALRQVLDALQTPANTVRLVGGMTRSASFVQLVEQVCDITVTTGALPEASGALAAALPVALYLGWFPGLQDALTAWFPRVEQEGSAGLPPWEGYERLYRTYCQIYPLVSRIGEL